MQIHHDKHHNTYVVNINKALEGKTQPPLVEMQKSAIKTAYQTSPHSNSPPNIGRLYSRLSKRTTKYKKHQQHAIRTIAKSLPLQTSQLGDSTR
eukprot:3623924-Amphidinium_carterae.1